MDQINYRETLKRWVGQVNKYNKNEQVNLIFRILFNILIILVRKETITYEQADGLVMNWE